jgi:transposase
VDIPVIPDATFLQIFDLARKVSDPESKAVRSGARGPGFRTPRFANQIKDLGKPGSGMMGWTLPSNLAEVYGFDEPDTFTREHRREGSMEQVKVIGIDLAKGVFEVCLKAADGHVVSRRRLRRGAFERYMAAAPRVLVGLEAGPGAHYWARRLDGLGFVVKVMSPRAVSAYRTGPHKSDALDADAVGEAATRAAVRAVPVKCERAQTAQALVRVRDRPVRDRTRVLNQLRGLLLEFGIATARNLLVWYPRIAETPGFAALPDDARRLFDELIAEARALDRRVKAIDHKLARSVAADPVALRLVGAPGIGPINATQITAQIVEPGDFEPARALPASLGLPPPMGCTTCRLMGGGLVPRLIASGQTSRLGGITKHGPAELRRTLVLGGHAVTTTALRYPDKGDPLYAFARRLVAKGKPRNVVAVAVANKLARIVCAMLRTGQPYNPRHAAG